MPEHFTSNNIFCCAAFQNHVGAAGNRGIAVLMRKTPEGIGFLLQSRGVAFKDVVSLVAMPNGPDIKINIASDAGLQYCPWCGRRLADLVKGAPEPFEVLAKGHKPLLSVDI
jgi:hypothetical protein